ncbi:MAG: hypothetical protein WKF55_16105 [Gemmatimonadaceae bacterium]
MMKLHWVERFGLIELSPAEHEVANWLWSDVEARYGRFATDLAAYGSRLAAVPPGGERFLSGLHFRT